MQKATPTDAPHIVNLINQSRAGWPGFVPVKTEDYAYTLEAGEVEIFLHGTDALLEVYHHENATQVVFVYPHRHPAAPQHLEDHLLEFARTLSQSRGLPMEIGVPHTREEEKARLEAQGLVHTRTFYRMFLQGEAFEKLTVPTLPPGCSFRQIGPQLLTDMHNDAFQHHYGFFPMGVKRVEAWFGEPGFVPEDAQALYVQDAPVAFFATGKEDDGGHVYLLGTLQHAQKQGYGHLALQQACALLKSRGAGQVQLGVDTDNTHALNFYRKVGFQEKFSNLRYRWPVTL